MRHLPVLAAVLAVPFVAVPPADAATPTCDGHRATIVGTPGDDLIIGTAHADVIVALTGSDHVDGRGGNDRICGGYGADRLRGGYGDDRVFGGMDRLSTDDEGTALTGDTIWGGPGRDRLVPGRDTRPADDVNHDAISWDTSPRAVHVVAATGTAYGDGPDSFVSAGAWLVGSRYGDDMEGTSGADLLMGGDGSDVLHGYAGADRLLADTGGSSRGGADRVWGGSGDDELSSGPGEDALHGGSGNDVLDDMGRSADVLTGDDGDDLLIGEVWRSTLPQVYAGGAGHDRFSLFSNLFNPTAADATGTWDMATGRLVLTFQGAQALTASGLEEADLSTFGTAWTVTGTAGADEVNVGSMHGSDFYGLGGPDRFLGSAGDDFFDGGDGTDRSLGMGDGSDQCRSVEEVLDAKDCETVLQP